MSVVLRKQAKDFSSDVEVSSSYSDDGTTAIQAITVVPSSPLVVDMSEFNYRLNLFAGNDAASNIDSAVGSIIATYDTAEVVVP
jgi:hypothetical protein